jgi:hypothetical protein
VTIENACREHESSSERIVPRYEFEARIGIRFESGRRRVMIEGWARDLSESGLGAFVAHPLTVGTSVTLVITLTRSTTLELPALVAVSIGTRYGFRFTALSTEQRSEIQSAVRGQPALAAPAQERP